VGPENGYKITTKVPDIPEERRAMVIAVRPEKSKVDVNERAFLA
jgi:hypothetical protein